MIHFLRKILKFWFIFRGSFNGKNSQKSLSNDLQQTNLKILNNSCSKYIDYNSNKLFCAIGISLNNQENSNACFGDSGSPVFYCSNERCFIYGVTSFVITSSDGKVCDPRKPSYYTRVFLYLNWIDENI